MRSVRRFAIVATVAVLNLLALLVALAWLQNGREDAEERARSQVRNLALLVERDVASTFDGTRTSLAGIASRLEAELASGRIDRVALPGLLDDARRWVPEVLRYAVFDATGREVCATPEARCMHRDIADRDHYRILRDNPDQPPVLSAPLRAKFDGEWAVVMAKAIRHRDGSFAGVVTALVPLRTLQASFERLELGREGTVSLRTASLELVARHPGVVRSSDDAQNHRISDEIRAAIAKEPDAGTYRALVPLDGVDRILAYRRLERFPYVVIVGLGTSEALAAWTRVAGRAAAGLAFFLVASALAAFGFDRLLSRRERDVEKLARVLAEREATLASGVMAVARVKDGRIAWASPSFALLLGLDRAKDAEIAALLGEGASGEQTWRRLQSAVAQGRTYECEFERARPDGSKAWFGVRASGAESSPDEVIAVFQDVTERRRTEEALQLSERRFMLSADAGGIGVWDADPQTGEVWVSPVFSRLFGAIHGDGGWSVDRILAHTPEDERAEVGRRIAAAFVDGNLKLEHRIRRHDGVLRWVAVEGAFASAADGRRHLMGTVMDVTARREAEDALRLHGQLIDHMDEGVALVKVATGRFVHVSRRFAALHGCEPEDLVGAAAERFLAGEDDRSLQEAIAGQLARDGTWRGDVRCRRRDGTSFWTRASLSRIAHHEHGEVIVAVQGDIDARKRLEVGLLESNELLGRLATRDPLTGLHNRRHLDEALARRLAQAREAGTAVALVMLEIDGLRRVHESLGHAAGDDVLKGVARRLAEVVRDDEIACRYDGAAFLVVMPATGRAEAEHRAEVLRRDTAAIAGGEGALPSILEVACGLGLFPDDGGDAGALVAVADRAMRRQRHRA